MADVSEVSSGGVGVAAESRAMGREIAGTAVGKRVLVVDDDVDIRETLVDLLRDEGYRAVGAANGLEALRLLRETEHPCAIVLDLMMPVMDGEQFRDAQRKDPGIAEIPIVAITAGRHSLARIEGLAPAAFLPKPLRLEDLLSTLARLCESCPD